MSRKNNNHGINVSQLSAEELISVKIQLWTQMQQMVVTIENRNFNVLGFGTLGTLAVTVLCNYSTHELSKMLHIIMPLLILLV